MGMLKTFLLVAGCAALLGTSAAQASYQHPGGIEPGIGDRSWAVTGPHYRSGDYPARTSTDGSTSHQLPGGLSPGFGDSTSSVTGSVYRTDPAAGAVDWDEGGWFELRSNR